MNWTRGNRKYVVKAKFGGRREGGVADATVQSKERPPRRVWLHSRTFSFAFPRVGF